MTWFAQLVHRWGYLAIGVGTYLEGEGVLLSAGALCAAGVLSLPLVVLSAALGSAAWGQTWFRVGLVSGRVLIDRRPAWQRRAQVVERWLARSGLSVLLFGRFIAGMGTLLPTLIGASGYDWRRFSVLDALGASIWAVAVTSAGCALGAGARWASRSLGWLGLAASAVFAAALGALIYRLYARAVAHRLTERSGAPRVGGGAASSNKRVIITGDDFGLAVPVNEAIELGFREGVLTTTSLLVAEHAAADAILRARANPGLRVGLHLAVCDGRPLLPSSELSTLVNARGELRHPVLAVLRLLLFAGSRSQARQLEAEMRAQFEAFRATGLTFDHVNGHNNMQLHPVVLPILMRLAREYGVQAVRVPYEPLLASWRAARNGLSGRFLIWLVMRPWSAHVKRRLLREGFVVNDYLFGIFDCGGLDGRLLRRIIEHLPDGLSEIHCHPATRRCPELDKNMPRYGHERELGALTDPAVRAALVSSGVEALSGYLSVLPRVRGEPRP